jgi:hypothetical protein
MPASASGCRRRSSKPPGSEPESLVNVPVATPNTVTNKNNNTCNNNSERLRDIPKPPNSPACPAETRAVYSGQRTAGDRFKAEYPENRRPLAP